MPFQAGSENFELSFQGKSLRLSVVHITEIGMSGPAGWEPRGCGFRVLVARPVVWSMEASGRQKARALVLALTYSSYVTSGAAPGLSRPQFSDLSNGGHWATGVTSSFTVLSFRFWACCFPAEAYFPGADDDSGDLGLWMPSG